MLDRVAIAALLLFSADYSRASAADALVLEPSSPWNLRYDEDKCRMVGQFGEGSQQVTLMLDQAGVEPYYTLSLIGHPVRQANGNIMEVRFGDEQPTQRSFLKGKLGDKTPLIAMHGVNLAPVSPIDMKAAQTEFEIESIGPAREAAIQRIVFSRGLDDPVTLETGSLGDQFAAMRKCATDLVTYLGIGDGPNPNISQAPAPKNNPGTWLGPDDYPAAMLQREMEGRVHFRLTVDSQGSPTSCHITRSTRPQVFDDAVCLALLKRARFKPALDAQGKPVAAYWSSSVRWEIPD